MKKIFPVFLGMMLAMSLLLTCPVYAKSEGTQTITLTSIDDWYENALAGTQVTLAEKIEDSYVEIEGKTDVTVPAAGMELELEEGTYRLTVEKTPNGYETSEQPVEFQVTESEVTILQAENAEIAETDDGFAFILFCAQEYENCQFTLPSTGGTGSMPYLLSGLLLAAAAALGGIFLSKKSAKKLMSFLLFMGAFAVLAGSVSPMSVQAANNGSSQRGYHWYAMMKTLDGDAEAEYYVEDENLAKALEKLTVRGKSVFTVEAADNGIWYVTTSEDADCTTKEVAKALASIKDYAIESGITTDLTVELETGAVILVQTRAGTYFLVEMEAGQHYLVERPAAVDKNYMPTIKYLKVPADKKNNAEIGGKVDYELEFSFGGEMNVQLCIEATEGLTMNESPTGTELTLTQDTENSMLMKQVYTIRKADVDTSNAKSYIITGAVTINENAKAGAEQTLSAYIKYGDNEYSTEPVKLKIYTFGFDLQRLNSVNEPVKNAKFELKNADGKYYASSVDSNGLRFQEVRQSVTTDTDGKISFVGLAEGTYTLTEIEQSEIDAPWTKEVTIKIDSDGKIIDSGLPAGVLIPARKQGAACDTLIITGPPKISSFAVTGKANAEIGGIVNYEIKIAIPKGTQNVQLCMQAPTGLTLGELSGSGLTLEPDNSTSNLPGEKNYTITTQNGGEFSITGSATMNENATAGAAQVLTAKLTYGAENSQNSTETLNFYTFGFDLQRLNSVNNPLPGVPYTLSKKVGETTYYYKLPSDESNVKEARFQAVPEGSKPTVTTDADGKISFRGLAEGTYTLTEIVSTGDDASVAQITIKINDSGTLELIGSSVQGVSVTENKRCNPSEIDSEAIYYGTLTITNQANIIMPMTGSNSRIAFQMAGSLLTVLAGALLVSRRKEIFHVK